VEIEKDRETCEGIGKGEECEKETKVHDDRLEEGIGKGVDGERERKVH
jgi:hypothetical protein